MCCLHHKPACFITKLILVIGGLNWGLVGLGGFLGKDLNVVHMILGSWPTVEWIVYILVGVAAIVAGYFAATMGEKCACNKE